jgi:GNAT superfamily N-acetyltransferase
METISLRPSEPERDFGQIATLITLEQDEPTTESALKADYEEHRPRIIRLMVAENQQGDLLGFNWVTRSRSDERQAYFYLIVKSELRGQGAGRRLYEDLEGAARAAQMQTLHTSIRDNCARCRVFAERRGFIERSHAIAMALDLKTFDDRPYSETIARLQLEGLQFTSIDALGNTEEAQRKLFALNNMTAREIPGSDGEPAWLSFEDFRDSVCRADWYKPDGQMVVIDNATGAWAGMSAITRFEGVDYAYNLHTGVDKRYRGRKLAQAVKVVALRYARDVLQVDTVRTHHNALNAPMIAIDHKLGYVQIPGMFAMEKTLE